MRLDHGRLSEELVQQQPEAGVAKVPATGHRVPGKGDVRTEPVDDVRPTGFLPGHRREPFIQVSDDLVVDDPVELPDGVVPPERKKVWRHGWPATGGERVEVNVLILHVAVS